MDIRKTLDEAMKEVAAKAQAEVCLTCANCEPSIKGGCFLRETVLVDLGSKFAELGAKSLFTKVSELRQVSPELIRQIACPAYSDELGYPTGHPKAGGWVCARCGRYLSSSASDMYGNLKPEYMQCSCGADGLVDGYYAV